MKDYETDRGKAQHILHQRYITKQQIETFEHVSRWEAECSKYVAVHQQVLQISLTGIILPRTLTINTNMKNVGDQPTNSRKTGVKHSNRERFHTI